MTRRCWWCGLLLLAAAGVGPAAAPEGRPLVYGADAEGGAPYIFKDPNDPERNIGFEVDLAGALARELGRPVEFKQYEFSNLVPGLLKGDFDFALNGLEVTPDRREQVRFSRPYYVYKLQLVVRADEERFQSLKGVRQHKGAVVGTMEDTAAERLLDQLKVPRKSYPGPVEAYADLANGQGLDAVLLDLPMAVEYVKKNKDMKGVLKLAGQPTGKGYYALAFRKDDEELAAEVDAALGRLLDGGELRRIYKKWGLWNDNQEELMPAGVFEEGDEQGEDEADVVGEARQKWSFWTYFPLLLEGAWWTVRITLLSFALAMAVGLPVALARLYGPGPLRRLATLYVEFFRGIPVLLLLFFLYFGLAGAARNYGLAFSLTSFQAAVLGLGLTYAAYEAEVYRAGIQAVAPGQWEAAASLGMSGGLTFRRIILPQAVRVILPPTTGDFVALFKDTSIVSGIALVELSKQYQLLSKSSGKYVEVGLVTAVLYLIMSVPLGYLSRHLERRWGRAHEE